MINLDSKQKFTPLGKEAGISSRPLILITHIGVVGVLGNLRFESVKMLIYYYSTESIIKQDSPPKNCKFVLYR